MAAGAGYIEFSTGDILTASAANSYLASQVVMVFADAAARTSAIASPQEGMISYLKDTNSTEYYSGSAWAAIGGGGSGGDLVRITKTTFTGSSAVNIDNCFSSTYDFYVIQAQITGSAGNYLYNRMRSSGTNNTASSYSTINTYVKYSDSTSGYDPASSVSYGVCGYIRTTDQQAMDIRIMNPFVAQYTAWTNQMPDPVYKNDFGGLHAVKTSYDGISIYPSGGTITGEINVYGYKKG
jgi:hypothetical protein